jgi:hypothetical protein
VARIRTSLGALSAAVLVTGALSSAVSAHTPPSQTARDAHVASQLSQRAHINCANGRFSCTEIHDSEEAFGEGHYVGHDEPSLLFYSNKPGSGNRMRYTYQLPKDPPARPISGRSYNFQLQIASWFGMAMCDTQSYPEQLKNCKPDSDSNIKSPSNPNHAGTAFMEMQFYPPGWVPFQYATSCSATAWCAALTIDSYSLDPVSGAPNNDDCLSKVGIEPVNFAFITKSGIPHAPPDPLKSTLDTFTPNPKTDLFMQSGDQISITMHDTSHGLRVALHDSTSGRSGFMTASAANGFAQIVFDPSASTCQSRPYDFHPMYSTTSEKTRVPWAAHSYNIAYDDEIGHFDYCTRIDQEGGSCTGREGVKGDYEPADGDDVGCFSPALSFRVDATGCLGTNTGFDGVSYLPRWPDGNTYLHPTPQYFTSPLTGHDYGINYSRVAFESDVPRITADDFGGSCDRDTGAGCHRVPRTDDGAPATFYPYFSSGTTRGGCMWTIGTTVPGFTTNDYGGVSQYGSLLRLTYLNGDGTVKRYNDYRKVLPNNPCKA